MDHRPIRDGQAMFDVSLQAAHRRIADLQADGGSERGSTATSASSAPGLRYALGVRLLALGAALVADDSDRRARRPLARG